MPRIRITRVGAKAVFVTAAVASVILVGLAANAVFRPPSGLVAASLAWVIVVVAGTRWFRGEDEAVGPPRVWWRMTALPLMGYVLGAIFVLNAGTQAYAILTVGAAALAETGDLWPAVIALACNGLIAAAYLHSSIRLSLGHGDAA
ncbi:hypothetical protein [Agromyces albus]|uniref:Uncharacterized protein n=1 Tax=Agromyces albus TaxID=205332 RepID=A0A4V1QYF6_9MICO|nr:hypothetical protein [Agromyces albus]RXZ72986.1 hypothetical protein ESP51_01825 [Agromyces albus]